MLAVEELVGDDEMSVDDDVGLKSIYIDGKLKKSPLLNLKQNH